MNFKPLINFIFTSNANEQAFGSQILSLSLSLSPRLSFIGVCDMGPHLSFIWYVDLEFHLGFN